MRVIGTAGHVDHGKSTLVLALTGMDPDRLKEEKAREMTIDLGFAWMTLPGGEPVGVVDVPGHIDFIKNMLAGVGGIDAALFVIAADEGIMPQTREHLAILDLLQVPAGVIALTKTDVIDEPEWIEMVQGEVRQATAQTILAQAPIVPVSARHGSGLDELKQALEQVLATVPPRRDRGRPRLPVDRVFTVAGFGTVVTGTLTDGRLAVGDEVEIFPSGTHTRIRGLQTHKQRLERAVPGSRVAVNLSNLHPDEIRRGHVLALPGTLTPSHLVDVRLRVLADADMPLEHNREVELFVGATEQLGRARLLNTEKIEPGGEGWVQLQLTHPVAVVAGDHFILRQPSPSQTLGGGTIVNAAPGRRHRRFQPAVLEDLQTQAHGSPSDLLLQTLERQEPASSAELLKRSGMPAIAAQSALHELLASGQVIALVEVTAISALAANTILISLSGWHSLLDRAEGILSDFHHQYPLRLAMPREEFRRRLEPRGATAWSPRLFAEILSRQLASGRIAEAESGLRLPDHHVQFSPAQQKAVDRLLAEFRRNPLNTPSFSESVAGAGADVVQALLESKALIKLNDEVLLLGETYSTLRVEISAALQAGETITVAQVRDRYQTSRKYALALLEYFDAQRITRRVGDTRVLR